ncbi:hypothetical protein DRO03_06980 [Methanosarcinales archaeon]|nr:MAG: hypothetical protein DRO03_06980 [Methanosarcinales archaeon]
MKQYLIQPPSASLEGIGYLDEYHTYSEYNYLRPGIASYIKRRHFEICLRLTLKYFHKVNVIDFGCADGYFIPSLARYFNNVVAVDISPNFIRIAHEIVDKTDIHNVDLICNEDLTIDEIATKLSGEQYHILFLLEVLEHIGDEPDSMYESKIDLLKQVSTLIDEDGIIVISVPKMVGITFLFQRVGLTIFRMKRERISLKDLIKASIFNDTSNIEKKWDGGHVGFNYKKLEKCIRNEFDILQKRNDLFQIIYVIGKRKVIH